MCAERPRLTVIVPCLNEEKRLPKFLDHLEQQTIQPDEIIVADGMSEDRTRELLRLAAPRFIDLQVVDNIRRHVPAALNLALRHSRGEYVARMDTHADYDPNYLESVSTFLRENPEVAGVGGMMASAGVGDWGRAIASVLSKPWGLGGARHRVGGAGGPIQHVFSGCYRREALEAIQGWDERLKANEDFEADVRMGANGRKIWLLPETRSTWYVRESPRGLAKQMFRYGHYKALTLKLHPTSFRVRQAAPLLVVLLIAAALTQRDRRLIALTVAYAIATAILGARSARQEMASPLKGTVVPALVHVTWGTGLLTGLFRYLLLEPRVSRMLKKNPTAGGERQIAAQNDG
ncbi:hypothetical protein Acsp06_46110 [Actinomycetospora sp. NBRC 106375]|uniref:glycosyltransferase family 2 protein n=1 Tax=Actinomycetospora sp. NBRC 106375 TaxID=3032207 RepID=UPI0024A5178B|nr:glycosyltransferase family 2 protein [Actinomycetospora sp. NBRC 106375]GLZ48426.1 hypothetical protein Acsp06_46110 [Actinomycetospora sp. NBRC 106375]